MIRILIIAFCLACVSLEVSANGFCYTCYDRFYNFYGDLGGTSFGYEDLYTYPYGYSLPINCHFRNRRYPNRCYSRQCYSNCYRCYSPSLREFFGCQ